MENFTELHEKIYQTLIDLRRDRPNLRYTFRKSNHAGRLEEGYWFYGNEYYLAISFWTGMDWKNRTPNIVFIITGSGDCFLEINVSDSNIKRDFVKAFLIKPLELTEHGRKYIKSYDNTSINTTDAFIDFINHDKLIIDEIIEEYSESFFQNVIYEEKTDGIGFISSEDFNKRHIKIRQYRKLLQELREDEQYSIKEEKPSKILDIQISNYGLIDNVRLSVESSKNQWIFITGNNGSGKTNLLRSIATVLGNRVLNEDESLLDKEFSAETTLLFKHGSETKSRIANQEAKGKKRPLVQGLAMYGPYRLDVSDKAISSIKLKKELSKEGSYKSLFKSAVPLLSIDNQFDLWRKGSRKEKDRFEKRIYYFKSVLTDVVPDLVDIWFNENSNQSTDYVFRDKNDDRTHCIKWADLPSGIKSTIALLGDILIRFYDQQRFVDDPSELKGVVIIDEIDLHLHPQGQRDLIINLSKTFPNIQFIVTTHSPIPLLGAPSYSEFYRVIRSYRTVSVQSLDFIKSHITELLPNQLLTSELFDLSTIRSVKALDNAEFVFTGSTMTDYIEHLKDKESGMLKDPDNQSFLEELKKKLNEKSK